MAFTAPIPFREALQSREVKAFLPTSLSSRQLMRLAPELRERSAFSARTINAGYLQKMSDTVHRILDPHTVIRDGRPVTEGLDVASARLTLREALKEISYQPDPDKRGTIEDLSSEPRLNLVIKTNVEMAQGYGNWQQGQATLDAFPAQELFRAEERKEPRDWLQRWRGAGGQVFEGGRMIALKNDPIWTEISEFGLPYPPFDFGSGMDVRDVDREEAVALGLIGPDEQIEPQDRGFNDDLELSNPAKDAQLRAALETSLGEKVEIDGDVLKWKVKPDEGDSDHIRPEDRPEDRTDDDARRMGRLGEDVFRGIRSADAGVQIPETLAGVYGAQVAAVSLGRKPLFHEQIGEAALLLAQRLNSVLPDGVRASAVENHLYVFRPDTIRTVLDADPEFYSGGSLTDKIHRATLQEQNGELLGYGQRQLFQPGSMLVRIRDAQGRPVFGFRTRPALARTLAEAHLKDLAAGAAEPLTVEFGI
jgi:hypothetical protein